MRPPEAPPDHTVQVYLADANVLYSRVLRDYLLHQASDLMAQALATA